MRILVLSNKCPPDYDGGYELSAFQVASALKERGYDVALLTSNYRPTYTGPKNTEPPWVTRRLSFAEWPALRGSKLSRAFQDYSRVSFHTKIGIGNAQILREFLVEHPVDLAYCFGLQGVGLATAHPFVERKIPILWHAGNYLIAQDLQLSQLFKRDRILHRLAVHGPARSAYRMVTEGDYSHVAFLSDAMRKVFVGMGYEPPHSYIIPRGIDFPIEEDVQKDREPIFLMASRIGPEKGYDVVLEAAAILAKTYPGRWQLRIAGGGSQEYIDKLRTKARSLEIEGRVDFLGMLKREDVLFEMRNSYAFLSASLWEEPFGRTNIESLACGAALIAADTGAIREIVADSGCALLYEKNDANALAKIMKQLLEQPALRTELAQKGINRIKQAYTMDKILEATEEVFAQVMADYGKPFSKPNKVESNI